MASGFKQMYLIDPRQCALMSKNTKDEANIVGKGSLGDSPASYGEQRMLEQRATLLDQKMEKILNNKYLNEYEKLLRYLTIMQKYFTTKHQLERLLGGTTLASSPTEVSAEDIDDNEEVVEAKKIKLNEKGEASSLTTPTKATNLITASKRKLSINTESEDDDDDVMFLSPSTESQPSTSKEAVAAATSIDLEPFTTEKILQKIQPEKREEVKQFLNNLAKMPNIHIDKKTGFVTNTKENKLASKNSDIHLMLRRIFQLDTWAKKPESKIGGAKTLQNWYEEGMKKIAAVAPETKANPVGRGESKRLWLKY